MSEAIFDSDCTFFVSMIRHPKNAAASFRLTTNSRLRSEYSYSSREFVFIEIVFGFFQPFHFFLKIYTNCVSFEYARLAVFSHTFLAPSFRKYEIRVELLYIKCTNRPNFQHDGLLFILFASSSLPFSVSGLNIHFLRSRIAIVMQHVP